MSSIYTVLTVLPATEVVSTSEELPVFAGEVGLNLTPQIRRDGRWMVMNTFRYLHIRADPAISEEWYGVDARSVHQAGWRSVHIHSISDDWDVVAFWNVGLFSDFRGTPGWRDIQTTAGGWFSRSFTHWTWGLGAMAVQRPGRFLPLPVVSFSRSGEKLSLTGTLPTQFSLLYAAGPVQLGAETDVRLGTYHLTSDESPDTYSAFTTVLVGPTARWSGESLKIKANASWIPYRSFRKVVDDTVEEVTPARGWALGVRVDWTAPARDR